MLQGILKIEGMLQSKMLQKFKKQKNVGNENVANFWEIKACCKRQMLQKKKPMGGVGGQINTQPFFHHMHTIRFAR